MILTKLVINQVFKLVTKKFKLDKVLSYVEDDNELDVKVKHIEGRLHLLEQVAHPRRDFVVCEECKNNIKEKQC